MGELVPDPARGEKLQQNRSKCTTIALRLGDGVWFSPGEKRRRGATATTCVTHIAIQESLDGKVVD